jgi:SEFIR domain-containing protein/uncharacterized protein DUF4062/iSTAND domain-containing protein
MDVPRPKVFISYSHDSPEHEKRVLALAERLRSESVETQIDQYVAGTPLEAWPRWMLNQLDWADFVLVICTPTYYRRFRGHEKPDVGRGADWEGYLITTEIYRARSQTTKFVPVFFDGLEERFIPEPLFAHTRYRLSLNEKDSADDYEELHAFLTGKRGVRAGEIGPLEGKRKIFIGSTTPDLAECASEVALVLDTLKDWRAVRMEELKWSRVLSVERCQKRVQECDVYVGICGTLYGDCPQESEISIAEHEYEAAITAGMPRLLFLMTDDYQVPVELRESNSEQQSALQRKFMARLRDELRVRYFDTVDDLKEVMSTSLVPLLKDAMEGSRAPFGERTVTPKSGLGIYRLCDRGAQEDAFKLFFRQKMRDTPLLPQIYILQGEERENLDSLIDRFCTITIEKQLSPKLNLPRVPVTCRLIQWPDLNSPAPEEAVKLKLFEEVAEDGEDYSKPESATFAKLRQLSVSGILALKHEIRETRWSTKFFRLIEWYCRFWDEVAKHRPKRRLLIFISILYPGPVREDSWKSKLAFSFAFRSVGFYLNALQNGRNGAVRKNPCLCPIARLPPVRCVRANHLMDWFSNFKLCELHERENYRNRLFANRECVHMAHLEPELKKIVNIWRENRGNEF